MHRERTEELRSANFGSGDSKAMLSGIEFGLGHRIRWPQFQCPLVLMLCQFERFESDRAQLLGSGNRGLGRLDLRFGLQLGLGVQ